jgi:hypothetical protein
MKTIEKTIIFLIIITLFSCVKNINSFDSNEKSFVELPKEVQDTLLFYTNLKIDSTITSDEANHRLEMQAIYLIDFSKTYKITHKEIGPWVSHIELNDNKNSKIRIEQGTPFPIIIFNKYIYIPKDYNIFSSNCITKLKFKEYEITDR